MLSKRAAVTLSIPLRVISGKKKEEAQRKGLTIFSTKEKLPNSTLCTRISQENLEEIVARCCSTATQLLLPLLCRRLPGGRKYRHAGTSNPIPTLINYSSSREKSWKTRRKCKCRRSLSCSCQMTGPSIRSHRWLSLIKRLVISHPLDSIPQNS